MLSTFCKLYPLLPALAVSVQTAHQRQQNAGNRGIMKEKNNKEQKQLILCINLCEPEVDETKALGVAMGVPVVHAVCDAVCDALCDAVCGILCVQRCVHCCVMLCKRHLMLSRW
jgi:hypothetical protein